MAGAAAVSTCAMEEVCQKNVFVLLIHPEHCEASAMMAKVS